MSGPRQRNGYHGTGLTAEAHAVLRAEAFATGQPMSKIASRIILAWHAAETAPPVEPDLLEEVPE